MCMQSHNILSRKFLICYIKQFSSYKLCVCVCVCVCIYIYVYIYIYIYTGSLKQRYSTSRWIRQSAHFVLLLVWVMSRNHRNTFGSWEGRNRDHMWAQTADDNNEKVTNLKVSGDAGFAYWRKSPFSSDLARNCEDNAVRNLHSFTCPRVISQLHPIIWRYVLSKWHRR
jgi:hypothetical protein